MFKSGSNPPPSPEEALFGNDASPGDAANLLAKNRFASIAVFALLGFSVLGLGVHYGKDFWSSKKYVVYLELRALDHAGHPIAGAEVTCGDEQLGQTDSFGEWRRFMRRGRGEMLAVKVRKKVRGRELEASKNFVVPMRPKRGQQIDLKVSLKLRSLNHRPHVAIEKPTVKKAQVPSNLKRSSQAINLLGTNSARKLSRMDREQLRYLKSSLVPAMRSKLSSEIERAGLNLSVEHVPVSVKRGLIKVSAVNTSTGKESFSLLRSYSRNGLATDLSRIVAAVQFHQSNDIAKTSPRPGWQKRALIVNKGEGSSDVTHVYVAGFAAWQEAGVWTFWSPASGLANLAVFAGETMVDRRKLPLSKNSPVIAIKLRNKSGSLALADNDRNQ